MSIDMNAVEQVVAGSREGLAESGFELDCADRSGTLLVTVRPLENACAECLVPKSVFTAILQRELQAGGVAVGGIEVVYPVELND